MLLIAFRALCTCILLQIFYYNSAKHLDKPSGSSDEPANSNYEQLVQYAICSMFFSNSLL